MLDIMKFLTSIYVYISSKFRFPSSSYENINEAIKFAKKKGLIIFYICGFKKKNSHKLKYFINLDCQNYGITEDIFTSILHIISQFIRFKFSTKKEIL